MGQSLAARALVAMAGTLTLCGACGGPSGHDAPDSGASEAAPDTPSVSGIVPSRVFLARTTQVTLSGYATHWSASTKVDFGPGTTVEDLVAASPTALVADVTTTKSTPVGVRDVLVDDGSARERYAGAFDVEPPLAAAFQGTVAQGALALMTLRVLDTSTPLDGTAVRDLAGDVSYPDISLTLPSGVYNVGVATVSDYEVTVALGIDVDANAAMGDVDLVSGPSGATTEFPLPSGVKVTPRKPSPLAAGVGDCADAGPSCVAATGQIMSGYDSALYAFTPANGMAVLDFLVTTPSNGALNPAVALLPSSGHFGDLLAFGYQLTTVAPGGVPLYAVYWENTGGTGAYEVKATATDVAQSAATTPADQSAKGAIVVSSLPFVLTGGDLAKQSYDFLKLTLGPAVLRVQTTGDLSTDTHVTAYDNAMTKIGSIDDGSAADGYVTLNGAGPYYVEFSQGASFSPPHTKYTAILRYAD